MFENAQTDGTQTAADEAGAASAADQTTEAPASSTDTVVRPEQLPEDFWDAEAGAPKWNDVAARLTRAQELEAAEAARKEGVPSAADDYKLDLPENVVGLDGQPLQLIADHPAAKQVKELAAKHGLPQAAFTDLLATYATLQVNDAKAQAEQFQAEAKAELEKLGANAKARVDAVKSALNASMPDKAQALLDVLGTAAAVEAVELLIASAKTPAIGATQQGAGDEPKTLAQRMYGN